MKEGMKLDVLHNEKKQQGT